MQYVILAAGHGTRFTSSGYQTPKPLLQSPGYSHTLLQGIACFVDGAADHNDEMYVVLNSSTYAVASATGVTRTIPTPTGIQVVDYSVSPVASALSCALSKLNPNEPVTFLDSDAIYAFDLRKKVEEVMNSYGDFGSLVVSGSYLYNELGGAGSFSYYPKISDSGKVNPFTVTSTRVCPNPLSNDKLNIGVYVFKKALDFINAACAYMSQVPGEEHLMPEVFKYHPSGIRAVLKLVEIVPSDTRLGISSQMTQVIPYSSKSFTQGWADVLLPWRPLGSPEEYTAYQDLVNTVRRKKTFLSVVPND